VSAAAVLARPGAGTFAVAIGPRRRDRWVARAAGHRRAGAVPVALAVVPNPGGERWVRSIDGRRRASTVTRRGGALVERVGPLALTFRATASGLTGGARLDLRRAALVAGPLRVRLPRRLVPAIACTTRPCWDGLAVGVDVRGRRGRRMLAYGGILR